MDDSDISADEIDDNVALAVEIFGYSDSESFDSFEQALALDRADEICIDLIIIVENRECFWMGFPTHLPSVQLILSRRFFKAISECL